MRKTLRIVSAAHLRHYVLRLTFSDEKKVDVDFKEFLFKSNLPDIIPFRNTKKFTSFRVVDGNLLWGDYEMLFPIADLYSNRVVKNPRKFIERYY